MKDDFPEGMTYAEFRVEARRRLAETASRILPGCGPGDPHWEEVHCILLQLFLDLLYQAGLIDEDFRFRKLTPEDEARIEREYGPW